MIKVQVRSNEPLEAALRRFKRQCNYAGVFRLAKKYTFHEKRSDQKRREERERIRNVQRAQRKLEEKVRPARRKKSKVKAAPTTQTEAAEGQQEGAQAEGQQQQGQQAQGQQQGQAQENKPVTVDQVNAAQEKQREAPGGVDIGSHVQDSGGN